MATIKIDDIEYDLENLSETARQQLVNIQATDVEIQRLQAQLAMMNMARMAYANALKAAISH